jgi:putative two-component system response regulator
MVEDEEPDLILLDVDMPRLDGLAVCQRLKAHATRRLIKVVILTAHQDRDTRLRGLAAGADEFLSKPFDRVELITRTNALLRDRALDRQLDAAEGVILALARIVEARDRYTIHHAERVGLYAREIGRAQGLSDDELAVLYRGGVLHDLGKIVVPPEILLKRGPLTEDERVLMEAHSAEGARLCGSLRSVARLLPVIRHHHERIDGRGYPDRLLGTDIPLAARIAAVADGWDAMTSDRPYRAALDEDEARSRLRAGSGAQWDREVVDTFFALLGGGLLERVKSEQFRVLKDIAA